MMHTCEGTIEIDLVEFWKFVDRHLDSRGEVTYGVPRVNFDNQTLEVDYAESSDGNPEDWMVKPKAKLQWEELAKKSQEG